MKKIICGKEYNTDSSTLVSQRTYGNFGEEDGYEECVYITADGSYFLYTNGGHKSKHPEEKIKRLSRASAEALLGERA